jgi:DNA-binding CsgD family transcriptional regulator
MLYMPDMEIAADSDLEGRGLRLLLAVVLVATIVGGAIDLYLDAPDSWRSPHAIYEVLLIAVALGTSILLWRGWWQSRRTLAETQAALASHAAEREAWRASAAAALANFANAVGERFAAWGLTPTERDVAHRLLKGHSHKQIAFETGRSERTVRQHAVAVYQKSGLSGRAELSAFFLEDLLLPARLDVG